MKIERKQANRTIRLARRDGIALSEATWTKLTACAQALGLALDTHEIL